MRSQVSHNDRDETARPGPARPGTLGPTTAGDPGKVRLVRHDDVLAMRMWGWPVKGIHVIRVKVPDDVPAGQARIVVDLADMAGNARVSRTTVSVPSS